MPYQCRRFSRIAILVSGLLASLVVAVAAPADERAVENLAAFARVYGYVRFFHPSDEAATVDWDKVAIIGAEAVRDAGDREALRVALLQVFQPVAPSMELTGPTSTATAAKSAPLAPPGERLIFWQHAGLKLTDQPGPYRQQRVIEGEKRSDRTPLFRPALLPYPVLKTIASGLVLQLPLALPVDADGKTARGNPAEFAALQAQLASINLKTPTPTDWRLRVAGVVTVWNVFQHFHPYLDGIGVKWNEALEPALRRALHDQNGDDYWATLSELVAKSHDGHGYVYGRPGQVGEIPIRVAVVEDKLVVTGVAEGAPFRRGDIIERLDGASALDALRDWERYASGGAQLSEFRALNLFGEGPIGSVARLELTRDGTTETVEFTRTPERRSYFFNSLGEFQFPAFAEVRPGIFYVNLYSLSVPDLEGKLPQLTTARGVIFDWRWDGRRLDGKAKQIQPHADIIPHLIDQPVQASPMLTPQISAPDRMGWTYRESTWPVQPKAPRLQGRVVFINEPSVVSYGETCMAMIADYHLATLVGGPTAGCNGNANFIPLPGGFRVMWTGMDVRKHDRSPFYTVGFVPDFPVVRTLRAVKEGRDEYLEKAIEVIEQATFPAAATP
jgi:hypothetical protein